MTTFMRNVIDHLVNNIRVNVCVEHIHGAKFKMAQKAFNKGHKETSSRRRMIMQDDLSL